MFSMLLRNAISGLKNYKFNIFFISCLIIYSVSVIRFNNWKHYIWSTHFLILDLPSMRRLSTLTNNWYPVVYMVGYTDCPLENLTKFDIRSIRSLIRDRLTDRMFVRDDIRSTPIFIRDCHPYDIRSDTLPGILYLLLIWPVAFFSKDDIRSTPIRIRNCHLCDLAPPWHALDWMHNQKAI